MTALMRKSALKNNAESPSSSSPDESTVEERLSTIYRDDQGELPKFESLDRQRRFWWFGTAVWFVLVLCGVSVMAWIGLLLWKPWRQDVPAAMSLQIQAPTQLTPGQEEHITILWQNNDLRPLREASVHIFFPADFTVLSVDPPPSVASSSLWDLGLLTPSEKGRIDIKGVFYGSTEQAATIQALATYRHDTLEKEQQLAETAHVPYTTSTVVGTLTVPDRMMPGDQVALRYQVTNHSDQTLGPLIAEFTLPDGFVPSVSSSAGAEQQGRILRFPIKRLPPSSMTTLQVSGTMLSGYPGDILVDAAVGRLDPRGQFVALEQAEARSVVLAGDLALRLIVNGGSASTPIDSQAPLRVTLGYENTSGEPLKNVMLTLAARSFVNGKVTTGTANLIDWNQFTDEMKSVSSTNASPQTLTLSADQLPDFKLLAPGTKGSFDWILPLRGLATSTNDAFIELSAFAHISQVGTTSGTRDVRVEPLRLAYKTDADLAVEARYSTEEGAPLGSGPLPPQAGKTTGYRIFWRVNKTLHALDTIVIHAHVPAIVAWSQLVQKDSGDLTYDPASHEVRWTIPAMPEHDNVRTASFDVQVTPTQADVDRFAPLLEETTFTAHDTTQDQVLQRVKPALSTDLANDEVARGHGVVRKP